MVGQQRKPLVVTTRTPQRSPLDAHDIARAVTIPALLRHLSWRVRGRNRADCGLCKGKSKGTVSFTERVWKCHRCQQGGDIYSLVQLVNGCDFRSALQYLASLAGVRLDSSRQGYDEIAERLRQRERINRAAETLAEFEQALRTECRDDIHKCERVLHALAP